MAAEEGEPKGGPAGAALHGPEETGRLLALAAHGFRGPPARVAGRQRRRRPPARGRPNAFAHGACLRYALRTRLRHLGHKLRANLWFVPSVMTLASVLLSSATLAVDAGLPDDSPYAFLLFTAGPEGAGQVLTTIAGSMMAVMGVTFSITVVALSLASTQFGPRLLRNFIRDRSNQLVLGTFLATFTYSLLAIREVSHEDPANGVPEVTVTVAILLAMASLAVLIYFVHHVAVTIQADSVVATVHRELEENVDRMYPEEMGEEEPPGRDSAPLPPDLAEDALAIHAARIGYLQAVDEEEVMDLAERHDLVLVVRKRPGDFVGSGAVLLLAWPMERVTPAVEERLRGAFLVGRRRTTEQDVEFSIDQLVEVGIRALSPGINDPFTAMRCIDRLGSAVSRLCGRRIPSPVRAGRDGRVRVVLRRATFGGLVDAAFHQLRQYGRPSVSVTLRLLETLEGVAPSVRTAEQARHLQRHADLVLATSQLAGHVAADAREILERHERCLQALALAQERLRRRGQAPRHAREAS